MFSLIVSMQRNASVAKGPLVEIEEQPKKVAPVRCCFRLRCCFSARELSRLRRRMAARTTNSKVDDELFQREFVILALENVLVEGVEGDDCADVLDVLGR